MVGQTTGKECGLHVLALIESCHGTRKLGVEFGVGQELLKIRPLVTMLYKSTAHLPHGYPVVDVLVEQEHSGR